jgi:hypothetical protein
MIDYLFVQQAIRPNDVVKNVLPYMRVHSTERVVQQVHVSVVVGCSGQTDPLFLAAAQINTLQKYTLQTSTSAHYAENILDLLRHWCSCKM